MLLHREDEAVWILTSAAHFQVTHNEKFSFTNVISRYCKLISNSPVKPSVLKKWSQHAVYLIRMCEEESTHQELHHVSACVSLLHVQGRGCNQLSKFFKYSDE